MPSPNHTSVSIATTIKTDPVPSVAGQIRGGYRITVEGTRVMQFRDEDPSEWQEWQPEYFGDYLSAELANLFETLVELRGENFQRYDVAEAGIEATRLAYAFERLSGEYVRVAARHRPQEPSNITLVPEAERGYVVNIDSLCREAADCGDAFVDAAADFGHDLDRAPIPTLREYVEQLRKAD